MSNVNSYRPVTIDDIGTEIEVRDFEFSPWERRILFEIKNDPIRYYTDSPYSTPKFPRGLGIWIYARKKI